MESVPLLTNSKANGFVGVNLYIDDTGSIKNLPINMRASDICSCCGHTIQVRSSPSVLCMPCALCFCPFSACSDRQSRARSDLSWQCHIGTTV